MKALLYYIGIFLLILILKKLGLLSVFAIIAVPFALARVIYLHYKVITEKEPNKLARAKRNLQYTLINFVPLIAIVFLILMVLFK